MSGGSTGNIDVVRKVGIVGMLVGALALLHAFRSSGHTGFDPTAMLALGFVILASYAFGQLVEVIKLPHITGYLLAGLCLGAMPTEEGTEIGNISLVLPDWANVAPFSTGVLNHEVMSQLSLFDTLAVALIMLTAGGELKVDALRRGFRSIVGVLGGQTITILLTVPLFMLAVSGFVPWIGIPALADIHGDWGILGTLAIGGVVAAVSLATSPAATIAVINSSKARGPTTSTVLSAVVLKDVVVVVLFSILGALALSAAGGESTSTGALVGTLAYEIGVALIAGAGLGVLMALYVRFVNAEVLLFLVGVVFTASYLSQELHLETPLMFIAAGFVASNLFEEGDALIHQVERLSLPVYVVFFTLAGAHLNLQSLWTMLPFAIGLVVVRAIAMALGVWAGARISDAEPTTARYGWLGFLSQAGVAITLASVVGTSYGEAGPILQTLIVAGVALNEIIGPVALKIGLGLAGEIPSNLGEVEAPAPEVGELPEPIDLDADGLRPWVADEAVDDAWYRPIPTDHAGLRTLIEDVESVLIGLVSVVRSEPMATFEVEAQDYLRHLRREFLREHRRVLMAIRQQDAATVVRTIRLEQAGLADRWHDAVLSRSAEVEEVGWSPTEIARTLDTFVDSIPERIQAPYEASTLDARRDESPFLTARRAWLRLQRGLYGLLGGTLPPRGVRARTLVRYHLCGKLPEELEGIAALQIAAERHLARRTRSLFESVHAGYASVAARVNATEDRSGWEEEAWKARQEAEDEFQLALDEITQITTDGSQRATVILAAALDRIRTELPLFNSPDLTGPSRRFSHVYANRNRGLHALGTGMQEAALATSATYGVLALELEIMGLEDSVNPQVTEHADRLAREVRGRTTTHLERLGEALRVALARMEEMLADEPAEAIPTSGAELAASLREAAEPVERVVMTALEAGSSLHDELDGTSLIAPLLDLLHEETSDLTEHYDVPSGPVMGGEWRLPPAVPTVAVPFREAVVGLVQTSVTHDLMALNAKLMEEAETLVATLEEFRRVISFNIELAGAELDVGRHGAVGADTRHLVREMVLGPLGRSATRLDQLRVASEGWAADARAGVHKAVLDDLEQLRIDIVDGNLSTLRVHLGADRRRRLARGAEGIFAQIASIGAMAAHRLRAAVGAERLDDLRVLLGLPRTTPAATSVTRFAVPQPRIELPVVYRRLFSEHATSVGDLLTGRANELTRGEQALNTGLRRTVAVVGQHGAGKGALTDALARRIRARRLVSLIATHPATPQSVAAWFDPTYEDCLIVVDGLQWLLVDGRFDLLDQFVRGLLDDQGRNSWIIQCSAAVWDYVVQATPLALAFDQVVRLHHLSSTELQSAVLSRHAMSGYELRFHPPNDPIQAARELISRGKDLQVRRRDAWFVDLHRASGGSIDDALRLWMASIEQIDEESGTALVGPAPQPPLTALRGLDEEDLLALRAAFRQGWLCPTSHAAGFRTSPARSEALLANLAALGILDRDGEVFRIASHLRGPLRQVLTERGWLS